jgi:hypothetical protein
MISENSNHSGQGRVRLLPAAVLVLLAFPAASRSELLFWPASPQAHSRSPANSLAIGDLNGDQILDMATADWTSDSVSVFLGVGDGTFGQATLIEAGKAPSSLAIGDLNGDSMADLVVATSAIDQVAIFLGIGKGQLGPPAYFPVGRNPSYVAIGEMNGDQIPDLVVVNQGSDNVSVLFGTGGGAFGTPNDHQVLVNPIWVAIGDLNGDHWADLAVAESASDDISVLLGTGNGQLAPAQHYPVGFYPTCVAMGDMDRDGILDLAVVNYTNVNVGILRGLGDGTFGVTNFFGVISPEALAIGDVNGDEINDIVVTCGVGRVAVLRGAGNGLLISPTYYQAGGSTGRMISIADFNGDQVPDLALPNYSNAAVLLGLGDGTFGSADFYDAGEPEAIAVGDLDGDHNLDLVVPDTDPGAYAVRLLFGRGDGTFRVGETYDAVYSPGSVAIADLNGDQALDLALAGSFSDSLGILLGNGQGGFGAPRSFWAGDHLGAVGIADLNGDQIPDIAVTSVGALGSDSLAIFLGVGDGTFSAGNVYEVGDLPGSLAIGDLNGDPVPDLVVANSQSDNIGVLYGIGDGTFQTTVYLSVGQVPRAVTISDLNRDGVSDLAVADAGVFSQDLAVFLGKGGGEFGVARFYPAGISPGCVAIADFNGDQALDAVLTNSESDNVAVLLGGGDGTFGPPSFYGAGDYPESLALGDFNGDTLVDLAVTSQPLAILLGFKAPEITAPAALSFPAVTLGDTVSVDLTVSNASAARAPITSVTFFSPEMRCGVALPINIEPGGSIRLPILLEPRQSLNASGELHLHAIAAPPMTVQTAGDIRPLAVSSRRDPPDERVELGQELTVIVTPAPQVRVERGELHYSIQENGGQFVLPLNRVGQGFEATIPARHVTEDGLRYYVQVENSGVIAADPPGAPDSAFAVGCRFSSFPLSGPRFFEGRPIQVVTNFSAFDSGILHYRPAGTHAYASVPIDINQPIPLATIPDSVVSPRGIEYWMEITRGTETQTDPEANPGDRPKSIRVTVEGLAEDHDFDGGHYRMVSVPLEFGRDITLEALLSDQPAFGPYDPLRWRAFRYALADSQFRYVELSESSFPEAHRVLPGKAFWLASKEPGRIAIAPITGTSTPTDSLFRIPLVPDWNQVGNPFLFPVAWDSILVERGSVTLPMSAAESTLVEPPVAWRNERYELNALNLAPFDGYWIKNLTQEMVTLLIPPHEAPLTARAPQESPIDGTSWAIGIRAAAAGAVDEGLAGVSEGATNTWDPKDRSKPPMAPGESIALYFPHSAWEKHPGRYAIDMRGAYEPLASTPDVASLLPDPDVWGHVWRFDVAKSSTRDGVDEVALDFSGLDRVPEEAIVLLLDRHLEAVADLRSRAHYAFYLGPREAAATEEDARFVLLVGSEKFRKVSLGPLPSPPARTVLYPSYPNPFTPATLIRYDIAHSGPITIGIYDVRGALVRTLIRGHRDPGRYEIRWNGEDQSGKRAASGVYFCRLTGGDISEARKLILVR